MGPPWTRRAADHDSESVPVDHSSPASESSASSKGKKETIWSTGRRVDRAGHDRDHDGALVVARTDRVYYALGVLGLEKDFDSLEVDEMGRDEG